MIQFCIRVLRYSEGSAYRRLNPARLLRALPESLPLFQSGELSLTNAAKGQEFMRAEGIKRPEQKKDIVATLLGKTGREAEEVLRAKAKPSPPSGGSRCFVAQPPRIGTSSSRSQTKSRTGSRRFAI